MISVGLLKGRDSRGPHFTAHNSLKRKAEKNRPENDFASIVTDRAIGNRMVPQGRIMGTMT